MKVFFNDTETTGLSSKKQDIVQIGGLISENFKTLEQINLKCQPRRWDTISSEALRINHNTLESLKTYEMPEITWKKYSALLLHHFNGKKYVFAGQNAPFDRRFLREWWNFYRTKSVEDFDYYFEEKNLDLMDLSRALKKYGFFNPDNLRLGTVIEALNVKVEGDLHDALVDIKATGNAIYKSLKMVENIGRENPSHPIVSKFDKWKPLLN